MVPNHEITRKIGQPGLTQLTAVEILETLVVTVNDQRYRKELMKVFVNAGIALHLMERYGAASVEFQAALILDPNNRHVRHQLESTIQASSGRARLPPQGIYDRLGGSLRARARSALQAQRPQW